MLAVCKARGERLRKQQGRNAAPRVCAARQKRMETVTLSNQELTEAIHRYADMVYRIARVRMGQEADANDVFQEVFLRFVQHAAGLRGEAHTKAWLIRVTINCCNKQHASSWRKKTVSYDDTLGKELDVQYEEYWQDMAADAGTTPGERAAGAHQAVYGGEDDDDAAAVYAAVQALAPRDREVIHLFYYEDMSIRRISEILGCSEGSVKTRLSRARDRLRLSLDEDKQP